MEVAVYLEVDYRVLFKTDRVILKHENISRNGNKSDLLIDENFHGSEA